MFGRQEPWEPWSPIAHVCHRERSFCTASPCLASQPVRIPQPAYETLWDTTALNDKSLWPTDGSQPFVWSIGDSAGYNTHGDTVFSWKGDTLQKAMNSSCMFEACGNGKPVKSQNAAALNKCPVKPTVTEPIEECKLSRVLRKFLS
jgi:hypothetical protein